jgi:subtilisin family serine protease
VVLRRGGLTSAERSNAGVTREERLRIAGVELVSARGDRARALATLRADPDVEWAEPNRPRRVSDEPLGDYLWGLENTGPSGWARGVFDADIDAPEAWAISRGAGVTIAVVDTGVDAAHPDLAGKLLPGHDYVEDDSVPNDGYGHGTHVTGTIAAGENGVGIIGVAPDARILPLRVLDETGTGSSADVANAFEYAGDQGVHVVNASFGSNSASRTELLAIQSHPGTLFVVAAGNENDDNDAGATEYPCAYDEPNVLCVGATDPDDTRAAFSNFGATTVDLFAPGEGIVSTYPLGQPTNFGGPDGYEALSGTSMATPHVSGAAALVLADRPAWSTAQLKSALTSGVDRPAALAGTSVSGGRLNAATSVSIAARSDVAQLPPPPPPPPTATEPAADSVVPLVTAPRISGLGIRVRSRKRKAVLSFQLAADADVSLRLKRRRCDSGVCRWRLVGTRRRSVSAGAVRWTIGPRQGLPLSRGTWRVKLVTSAGSVRQRFRVR